MKLKELPHFVLPREKAITNGLKALNESELLALIIGSGAKGKNVLDVSLALLASYKNLHALSLASIKDLCEIPGISLAKALAILGSLELASRLLSEQNSSPLSGPKEELYANYALQFFKQNEEEIRIILFNKRKELIKEKTIALGSEVKTIFNGKQLLAEALSSKASFLLLFHNHPSGVPLPSRGEITMTQKLYHSLKEFNIELLDHVIFASNHYYSFEENRTLSRPSRMHSKEIPTFNV